VSGQTPRCAYCGEPLLLTASGIKAWRLGNTFVCNEFCADGVAPKENDVPEKQLQTT
jgi:hypothetical protein